ncbi:unnamed protein product [Chrysodeixis includens]|uniref:Adt-1/2-like domain-containing protein n=1 Tax=Chrysodeixis includens TaxID=689277 RepID=A0A9N8Q1F6_CHRIL|nr:unnamed protein product [Chrysodeixis includens]
MQWNWSCLTVLYLDGHSWRVIQASQHLDVPKINRAPPQSPEQTSAKTSGTWRRAVGGQWRAASACHHHCVAAGAGLRLVRDRSRTSIQLCQPDHHALQVGTGDTGGRARGGQWRAASACHHHCVAAGAGLRLVRDRSRTSIQLCQPDHHALQVGTGDTGGERGAGSGAQPPPATTTAWRPAPACASCATAAGPAYSCASPTTTRYRWVLGTLGESEGRAVARSLRLPPPLRGGRRRPAPRARPQQDQHTAVPARPPRATGGYWGHWGRARGGQWRAASACHHHCVAAGAGLRLVRDRSRTSIQLCQPDHHALQVGTGDTGGERGAGSGAQPPPATTTAWRPAPACASCATAAGPAYSCASPTTTRYRWVLGTLGGERGAGSGAQPPPATTTAWRPAPACASCATAAGPAYSCASPTTTRYRWVLGTLGGERGAGSGAQPPPATTTAWRPAPACASCATAAGPAYSCASPTTTRYRWVLGTLGESEGRAVARSLRLPPPLRGGRRRPAPRARPQQDQHTAVPARPPRATGGYWGHWGRARGGQWRAASACHHHCVAAGAGLRLVRDRSRTSIQLCQPDHHALQVGTGDTGGERGAGSGAQPPPATTTAWRPAPACASCATAAGPAYSCASPTTTRYRWVLGTLGERGGGRWRAASACHHHCGVAAGAGLRLVRPQQDQHSCASPTTTRYGRWVLGTLGRGGRAVARSLRLPPPLRGGRRRLHAPRAHDRSRTSIQLCQPDHHALQIGYWGHWGERGTNGGAQPPPATTTAWRPAPACASCATAAGPAYSCASPTTTRYRGVLGTLGGERGAGSGAQPPPATTTAWRPAPACASCATAAGPAYSCASPPTTRYRWVLGTLGGGRRGAGGGAQPRRHHHCVATGTGLRLRDHSRTSIQLCQPTTTRYRWVLGTLGRARGGQWPPQPPPATTTCVAAGAQPAPRARPQRDQQPGFNASRPPRAGGYWGHWGGERGAERCTSLRLPPPQRGGRRRPHLVRDRSRTSIQLCQPTTTRYRLGTGDTGESEGGQWRAASACHHHCVAAGITCASCATATGPAPQLCQPPRATGGYWGHWGRGAKTVTLQPPPATTTAWRPAPTCTCVRRRRSRTSATAVQPDHHALQQVGTGDTGESEGAEQWHFTISACHHHCVAAGAGLRLVRDRSRTSIQLCRPDHHALQVGTGDTGGRARGGQWRAASACHHHCVAAGAGLRLVRDRSRTSIQLCQPDHHALQVGTGDTGGRARGGQWRAASACHHHCVATGAGLRLVRDRSRTNATAVMQPTTTRWVGTGDTGEARGGQWRAASACHHHCVATRRRPAPRARPQQDQHTAGASPTTTRYRWVLGTLGGEARGGAVARGLACHHHCVAAGAGLRLVRDHSRTSAHSVPADHHALQVGAGDTGGGEARGRDDGAQPPPATTTAPPAWRSVLAEGTEYSPLVRRSGGHGAAHTRGVPRVGRAQRRAFTAVIGGNDLSLSALIKAMRDSGESLGCTQKKSPYQYATMVCTKYKDRVRRLSGLGMQISPALEDPDRPCRIACQDERVSHRFYLVNGHEGWFPLGTSCGKKNASYCVSGKCLEFGPDNTPLSEMVFTLPLLARSNTSRSLPPRTARHRRSLRAQRITVKATLDQRHLDDIIARLNLTHNINEHITYFDAIPENIEVDFNNPIHIAPEDTLLRKPPRPTWD